jgi:hypothetical protein
LVSIFLINFEHYKKYVVQVSYPEKSSIGGSLKTDLRFARPKIRGSTERAKRRSDENVVKTLWNPTAWWSE